MNERRNHTPNKRNRAWADRAEELADFTAHNLIFSRHQCVQRTVASQGCTVEGVRAHYLAAYDHDLLALRPEVLVTDYHALPRSTWMGMIFQPTTGQPIWRQVEITLEILQHWGFQPVIEELADNYQMWIIFQTTRETRARLLGLFPMRFLHDLLAEHGLSAYSEALRLPGKCPGADHWSRFWTPDGWKGGTIATDVWLQSACNDPGLIIEGRERLRKPVS
jgi:hypothetical protein